MEQVEHHITCETTGKILGHRDLVRMDAPVWKKSICNELGRLSQHCKAHAGNDRIQLIFHKYKPKDRKETYMRAVCDIRPPKADTHRTRLPAGGNLIDYPGEVSTPTSYLIIMKPHMNITISDVASRYVCMEIKKILPEQPDVQG